MTSRPRGTGPQRRGDGHEDTIVRRRINGTSFRPEHARGAATARGSGSVSAQAQIQRGSIFATRSLQTVPAQSEPPLTMLWTLDREINELSLLFIGNVNLQWLIFPTFSSINYGW